MNIAFIAFGEKGFSLAQNVSQALEKQGHTISVACGFGENKEDHNNWARTHFATADALVFVGATGIAVRTIAPLLKSKASDPAVVVLDSCGKNCIPLLSGHLGGANELAQTLSSVCGAYPVITTSSDLNNVFAVDSWARTQGLVIPQTAGIKRITSALLQGKEVECESDAPIAGTTPAGVNMVHANNAALRSERPRFYVGYRGNAAADLNVIAPVVILGIGCRKETPAKSIEQSATAFLEQCNVHPASLCCVASVNLKAEEPGLIAFAQNRKLPFVTFSPDELNAQEGTFSQSDFVSSVAGTPCVCERAAVAAGGTLLVQKTVVGGITFALAVKDMPLSWENSAPATPQGRLNVVGLGPGNVDFMSQEAIAALQNAQVLCGYHVYVDLAKKVAPNTPVFTTPMTKEIDRCRAALEMAASGKDVAMVCSGDAGVYGMAGLCLELAHEYNNVEVNVIPGITAALSGASRLGAPLTHDFCVISLSDLLTPWELIEQRLAAAAQADFCIALYNPASHKRADYLQKACDLLMQHGKSPRTVCGVVRNIGREGEETWTGTLEQLRAFHADMFCTAFVGNKATCLLNGKMVTPRGYQQKQQWNNAQ